MSEHAEAQRESSHMRARATALAEMLDAGTIARLETLGVTSGWKCLEVGAGSGSIAAWLCERVGDGGRVVAVDLYPELLDHLHFSNLEARRHDVTADEPIGGEFDLIHARYMLHWLPEPSRVLARLAKSLRPGGVLFVEEPDFVTLIDGSRSQPLSRVISAGAALGATLTGADNFYGRELPLVFEKLPLRDTCSDGRLHMLRGAAAETGTEWLRLCVEWIRQPVIDAGTATERDIAEVLSQLDDPQFMTPTPITISAWGRKT